MKVIAPKRMNTQVFKDAWNEVLDQTAKKLESDFESTVQTFKTKPKVSVTRVRRGAGGRFVAGHGDLFRIVSITNEIYFYLARGTKIRWALMSRDWRSKTRPRRIPAGPGNGWVVVAGRRAMQARGIRPRPGIKARNFDKMIAKKRNRPFIRDVRRATKRAAGRVF